MATAETRLMSNLWVVLGFWSAGAGWAIGIPLFLTRFWLDFSRWDWDAFEPVRDKRNDRVNGAP